LASSEGFTEKSRNLSRVIARANIRTYSPKRQTVGDYVVEHRDGTAHRAGTPCDLCDRHSKMIESGDRKERGVLPAGQQSDD
jgi:hypothetical protein